MWFSSLSDAAPSPLRSWIKGHAQAVQAILQSVRVRKWQSSEFENITLTQNGEWLNLAAKVDGKYTRYGYHAERNYWANGKQPPAALLVELERNGWDVRSDKAPERPTRATEKADRPTTTEMPPPLVFSLPTHAGTRLKSRQTTQKDLPPPSMDMVEVAPGDILVYGLGVSNENIYIELLEKPGVTKQIAYSIAWNGKRIFTTTMGERESVEAPDVTYVRLFGRKGWNDKQKDRNAIGGYIIRYYLDRLGVDYDRGARILHVNHGAKSKFGVDMTGDPTCFYVPASEAFENIVTPEVSDLLTYDGASFWMVQDMNKKNQPVQGITCTVEKKLNGNVLCYDMYVKESWDLSHLYKDSGVACLPASELTNAKVRQYGLPLFQAYYSALQKRVQETPLDTVIQLSRWRSPRQGDNYGYERERRYAGIKSIEEAGVKLKIPDIHPKRLLIRSKDTEPWIDITVGTPLPKGFTIPTAVEAPSIRTSRVSPGFYQNLFKQMTQSSVIAQLPLAVQERLKEEKTLYSRYQIFDQLRRIVEMLGKGYKDVPRILQVPDLYTLGVLILGEGDSVYRIWHSEARALVTATEDLKGKEYLAARRLIKAKDRNYGHWEAIDEDTAQAIVLLAQPKRADPVLADLYARAMMYQWLASQEIYGREALNMAASEATYWLHTHGLSR